MGIFAADLFALPVGTLRRALWDDVRILKGGEWPCLKCESQDSIVGFQLYQLMHGADEEHTLDLCVFHTDGTVVKPGWEQREESPAEVEAEAEAAEKEEEQGEGRDAGAADGEGSGGPGDVTSVHLRNDSLQTRPQTCLLYTSPSPRD